MEVVSRMFNIVSTMLNQAAVARQGGLSSQTKGLQNGSQFSCTKIKVAVMESREQRIWLATIEPRYRSSNCDPKKRGQS